jgi:hypothetical protein
VEHLTDALRTNKVNYSSAPRFFMGPSTWLTLILYNSSFQTLTELQLQTNQIENAGAQQLIKTLKVNKVDSLFK